MNKRRLCCHRVLAHFLTAGHHPCTQCPINFKQVAQHSSLTGVLPVLLDWLVQRQAQNELLGTWTLLGAPGLTSRNKKLLGTKGIAARSKDGKM